jgi:hypothetical protein
MVNKSILFILLVIFCFQKAHSQDILLQEFNCEFFELKYPKKWKADTTGNRYSFYYNPDLGDITISVYQNQHLSGKDLKQTLLDLNEHKESQPDIHLVTLNGETTCSYNYDANKIKYFIKAIEKGNTMYLVSVNWNEDSWDTFKELLMQSFNSFRVK